MMMGRSRDKEDRIRAAHLGAVHEQRDVRGLRANAARPQTALNGFQAGSMAVERVIDGVLHPRLLFMNHE